MSKRIFLPLLLFFAGLLGLVQQTVAAQSSRLICVDDAYEDNDTVATATPIEFGVLTPLAVCENDSDYYAIEVDAAHELAVDLTFTDADGDIDVYILNSDFVTVASATSTTDNETARYRTVTGGTHYIHVLGYQGAENVYSLEASQGCTGCISYQGRLEAGGGDASGAYEFAFTLYDSVTDGIQLSVATTQTIAVDDGLFAANLYFSGNSSTPLDLGLWPSKYLDIALRPAGSAGAFTTLSPRTELTAAPAALSLAPYTTISGTLSNNVTSSPALRLFSAGGDGLRIGNANFDGVEIERAGDNGIEVNKASGNGVFAESEGNGEYGGYFISTAPITQTGYGVYARANINTSADLTLAGNSDQGSLNDDGRIRTDPLLSGSDLYLEPNDHVFVLLDSEGSNSSSFDIRNGTGTVVWTVDENGNTSGSGSSVTMVESPSRGESLAMYGIAATENWFEDFGRSSLIKGRATVAIDSTFAEIVTLSADYHVFLTPHGPCSLYIAETTSTNFTVQAVDEACAISFDYRIVAKRAGYETQRMEPVETMADDEPSTFLGDPSEADADATAEDQPSVEERK